MGLTASVGTIFGGIVSAILLVAFVVYQVRIAGPERRRRSANDFFYAVISCYFFYGYCLPECLERNVIAKLRDGRIGDFARQFGVLALTALDAFSDGEPSPTLYYTHNAACGEDYYRTYVCFSHKDKEWQVRLDQVTPLGERPEVLPAKNMMDADGYIRLSDLPEDKRAILAGCTNPDKSNLLPDVIYDSWIGASTSAYSQRVAKGVAHIFCPVKVKTAHQD